MHFSGRDIKGAEISHLSLFMISIGVALVIIVCGREEILLYSKVIDKDSLQMIHYQAQDRLMLFLWALRERCWIIPSMFLLATTYLARMAGYFYVLWFGICIGTMMGIAMIRYGIAGIFLIIAAGFPQYIFYVTAFVLAIRLSFVQRLVNKRFVLQLVLLELMVITGCFLEGYVNLKFVEKIVKILMLG